MVIGDTNNVHDIFVHDQQTGETIRVSTAVDGSQTNALSLFPSLSLDGRYIAFYSFANNIVGGDTNDYPDVFLYQRWP